MSHTQQAHRAIASSIAFPFTLACVLSALGCALSPPDSLLPASELHLEVVDETGQSWPMDRAPWLPTFVLTTEGAAVSEVYLFHNVDEDAILRDLERAPFLASHLERAVDLEMLEAFSNEPTLVRPWEPLPPGEYLFVVPAWSENHLEEHFVRPVTVAHEAGSTLIGAWPPDAASGVPVSLSEVHFAFSGPVQGTVALIGHSSSSTLGLVRESCVPFGWQGVCYVATLTEALRPHERYRYDFSDVRDVAGRRLTEARLDFHTIRQAPRPRPQLDECALDELRVETNLGATPFVYCVLESDTALRFRVRFDRPFRARWVSPNDARELLAPRGELEVVIDALRPETHVLGELLVTGLDGETERYELSATSRPPLPHVAISESLPNPIGPEPAQEYVELHNAGRVPVRLEGWTLSDAADSVGDELVGELLPGERALVVPTDFDADLAGVPLGVQLIFVDASIGTGGLRNSGEALFLRDAEFRRVASLPAPLAVPMEGQCVLRPEQSGSAIERFPLRFPEASELGVCSPGLTE